MKITAPFFIDQKHNLNVQVINTSDRITQQPHRNLSAPHTQGVI